MEDDFYEWYCEWANDHIWTKEFAQTTTIDYELFDKREKERNKEWYVGTPEIPY